MGDQARVPAGVRSGGQWTNRQHGRAAVSLDREVGTDGRVGEAESIVNRDSVFTRRYDTVQDRLAMLQDELAAAVAAWPPTTAGTATWTRCADFTGIHRRTSC